MVDFESTFKWFVVLFVLIALLDRVVARDDNPLGSYQDLTAFLCGLEWVVVCPLLEVLAANLPRSHLLDDHCLLVVIAVPPYVVTLDEGVWVLGADGSTLAGACVAIVPFSKQGVSGLNLLPHDVEEVDTLLDLFEFLDGDESFLNGLEWAILQYQLVPLLGVALDCFGCGGYAEFYWSLDS